MFYLPAIDIWCIDLLLQCRIVSKVSSRGFVSWSSMLMQTLFLQLLVTNVTLTTCEKSSIEVVRFSLFYQ